MPSRNRVKHYIRGSYYHVYNRGVEKRAIFMDDADYQYLLKKLEFYSGFATIYSYCLMPNHFHFLLRNNFDRGIENFARGVFTSYSMHFNKKYLRVGHLFQERYKARLLKTEGDILGVISYIHANPHEDGPSQNTPKFYSSERFWESSRGRSSIFIANLFSHGLELPKD